MALNLFLTVLVFVISGDSMYPNMQEGDQLLASTPDRTGAEYEFKNIRVGDVIASRSSEKNDNVIVVHRVVSTLEILDKNTGNIETIFAITKGDNNDQIYASLDYVNQHNYIGKITTHLRDNVPVESAIISSATSK